MSAPYGGVVLDHFRRPRRHGVLPSPDVNVEGTNPLCGDRLRLQLALSDGGARIADARFTADACAVCVASASLLVTHVVGLTMTDAVAIEDAEAMRWLEAPVPEGRRACALLPLDTLRRGLREQRTASAAGA